MEIELNQNFAVIFKTLEEQGMKTTQIAHEIGFTTTSQLHNTIEGRSLLSTKAAIGLITKLNVNPYYLFLGKGEMFLSDETEIEKLKRENNEFQKENAALKETKKKLEKTNVDLIEISSAAIKYYKTKSEPSKLKVENDVTSGSIIEDYFKFKDKTSKLMDDIPDITEDTDSLLDEKLDSSTKRIKSKE